MRRYAKWQKQDLVISTGDIEGAVRDVIGERWDGSGMRRREGKAEAILHLRCIEVNGLGDHFFAWSYERWCAQLEQHQSVLIRTDKPLDPGKAAGVQYVYQGSCTQMNP